MHDVTSKLVGSGEFSPVTLSARDHEDRPISVRFTGCVVAQDDGDFTVYVTDDDRVVVYAERAETATVCDNPMDELRSVLSREAYCDLGAALDEPVVVDL